MIEERKESWNDKTIHDPSKTLFVTIFLGANDSAKFGAQFVPVEEYLANVNAIIQTIHAVDENIPVILITPPPVSDNDWLATMKERHRLWNPQATEEDINGIQMDRKNEVTEQYAMALVNFAKLHSYHYIDLYTEMMEAAESLKKRKGEDEHEESFIKKRKLAEVEEEKSYKKKAEEPAEPKYKMFLCDGLHLSSRGNSFLAEKLKQYIQKQLPSVSPSELLCGTFV